MRQRHSVPNTPTPMPRFRDGVAAPSPRLPLSLSGSRWSAAHPTDATDAVSHTLIPPLSSADDMAGPSQALLVVLAVLPSRLLVIDEVVIGDEVVVGYVDLLPGRRVTRVRPRRGLSARAADRFPGGGNQGWNLEVGKNAADLPKEVKAEFESARAPWLSSTPIPPTFTDTRRQCHGPAHRTSPRIRTATAPTADHTARPHRCPRPAERIEVERLWRKE